MTKPTSTELATISSSRYALLVEVKCQFLQMLPANMPLREKRARVHTLELACKQVMSMPPERFSL